MLNGQGNDDKKGVIGKNNKTFARAAYLFCTLFSLSLF